MNPDQVGAPPEEHGEAAAAAVSALLKATAERFAELPLEAEPAGFQAEQRRNVP